MTIDELVESGHEDAVVFKDPNYETCIIGVTTDDTVIYSLRKMVEYLMEKDKMSYEEAVEYIDYNTLGTTVPGGPKVMDDLTD